MATRRRMKIPMVAEPDVSRVPPELERLMGVTCSDGYNWDAWEGLLRYTALVFCKSVRDLEDLWRANKVQLEYCGKNDQKRWQRIVDSFKQMKSQFFSEKG